MEFVLHRDEMLLTTNYYYLADAYHFLLKKGHAPSTTKEPLLRLRNQQLAYPIINYIKEQA